METTAVNLSNLQNEELSEAIKKMGVRIEHLEHMLSFCRDKRVEQAIEALSEESMARNVYTPNDIDSYTSLWNNILIISQMRNKDILRAVQAMCTHCTTEEACCGLHRGQ